MTRLLFIVLGWILFAFLVHKVSTTEIQKAVWDPYDILQIPEASQSPSVLGKVQFNLSSIFQ